MIFALLLQLSSTAFAQSLPEIVVEAGSKSVPVAVPLPVGADADQAKRMRAVIERDLDLSGYFELVSPDAFLETSSAGVSPGEFDFADWRVIKAAVLAKTRITSTPDGLQVDLYVYDVNAGNKLIGKRFTGTADQTRYLGHKVADAILLAVTGKPGFFGSQVLAVGTRTGTKEIYIMDMDGAGVQPVTHNGSINLSPAWSPDGQQVAWTSYKRGNPDAYVKDLASGRTRVLSNQPGINSGVAFSPDGKQVALARTTQGDADIYVLDAASGKVVNQLTKGGGIDVAPDFSPDGQVVVYSSERSGGSQIYAQNLLTGETWRVTHQGGFNFDPVLSPDGKQVAYVGRDKNFDVFVCGLDGRNNQRVTQGQGNNEDPSWSPDGRYLLFASTRSGRSSIWLSTADGRNQVRVTPDGEWFQPTWSPR